MSGDTKDFVNAGAKADWKYSFFSFFNLHSQIQGSYLNKYSGIVQLMEQSISATASLILSVCVILSIQSSKDSELLR